MMRETAMSMPGRGPRDANAAVLGWSALAHVVLICLFSLSRAGGPGAADAYAANEQPLNVELVSTAAAGGRRDAGGDPHVRDLPITRESSDTAIRTRGAVAAARQGDAALADELAGLLADDPLAGVGRSDYGTVLRRHIAAYSRRDGGRIARRDAGLVVLRFRVARDGQVVDARVLKTPNGSLGERALAALWRAEPLPKVPDALVAPIEVDVPIDFQVGG